MTSVRAGIVAILVIVRGAHAGPCDDVRHACERAGFVEGGDHDGAGLWKDCVGPIMSRHAQRREARKALPAVDSDTVTSCRTSNPQFGIPITTEVGETCTTDTLAPAVKSKLETLVKDFITAKQTPGVELAILEQGTTVFECGFGEVTTGTLVVPGPDTHFQIDSLTKVFTAMAALKLVEDGTVDLDTNMGHYIKKMRDPWWETVPVRDYLDMSTGIVNQSSKTDYKLALEAIDTLGPKFPAGTKYLYSDPNYFLLGNMIAITTGKSFDRYAIDTILAPLGMKHTGLITFETGDGWATPYLKGKATTPRPPIAGFSGGGFVSTMHDLEKFAIAIYQRQILSAKTYKQMWTLGVYLDPAKSKLLGYGLGWDIELDDSGNLVRVSKNGGGWGWGSQFNYYMTGDVMVIVLANGSGPVDVLAGNVHDAL